MLELITALIIGIVIGMKKFSEKDKKHLQRSLNYLLLMLIFFMGAEMGSNSEIMVKLPEFGSIAIILALSTILGSIIFVYVAEKTVLGDG